MPCVKTKTHPCRQGTNTESCSAKKVGGKKPLAIERSATLSDKNGKATESVPVPKVYSLQTATSSQIEDYIRCIITLWFVHLCRSSRAIPDCLSFRRRNAQQFGSGFQHWDHIEYPMVPLERKQDWKKSYCEKIGRKYFAAGSVFLSINKLIFRITVRLRQKMAGRKPSLAPMCLYT